MGLDLRESSPLWSPEASLAELRALLSTAGGQVRDEVLLPVRRIDPATLIGSGQARAIAERASALRCSLVVFDTDLKPRQQRNLEKVVGLKIVDRTALILDIFAARAHSAEGKLQVERAQIEYLLPRLSQLWVEFSRTGGGIGTRGPGETQLEADRRELRARMGQLDEKLEAVRGRRALTRSHRRKQGTRVAVLVGYTNAGKSSLLNALTRGGAFVEDKLFATLDPLGRRVELPNGRAILLSDTVGFIQRLPARLVAAFRATLEELNEADMLIHVLDISSPMALSQLGTVEETLRELGLADKPRITAFNKIDLVQDRDDTPMPGGVPVSALTGEGLQDLLAEIARAIASDEEEVCVSIPFEQSHLVDLFHREGVVVSTRYTAEGAELQGSIPRRLSARFRSYLTAPGKPARG